MSPARFRCADVLTDSHVTESVRLLNAETDFFNERYENHFHSLTNIYQDSKQTLKVYGHIFLYTKRWKLMFHRSLSYAVSVATICRIQT